MKIKHLVLFLIVVYSLSYLLHPHRPALPLESWRGQGWVGWFDQGEIDRIALSLANFHLPSQPFYPLGYPLVGAFFIRFLYPHHFFLPNLVLFTMTVALWYLIAKKYLKEPWDAVFLFLLVFFTQIRFFFAIPWSHFLAVGLSSVLFYFFFSNSNLSFRTGLIVSSLTGAFLFIRPEYMALIPITANVIHNSLKSVKSRKPLYLILLVLPLLSCFVIFFTYNSMMYGEPTKFGFMMNPPGFMQSQTDFRAYSLESFLKKTYSYFVSPNPFYRVDDLAGFKPIIWYSPFFLLSVFGLHRFYKLNDKRGFFWFFCMASSLLALVFSYTGSDVVSMMSLKYLGHRKFVVFFPLLTILSCLGAQSIIGYKKNSSSEKKATAIVGAIIAFAIILPYALNYAGFYRVPYNFNVTAPKQEYLVGEEVVLTATITDENLLGIADTDVHGTYSLSGSGSRSRLTFTNKGGGEYASSFNPPQAGEYEIVLMSTAFGTGVPDAWVNPRVYVNVTLNLNAS